MKTSAVVWGTPAVVFCVLTVCLVVPLAGSSVMMERCRFLGLLFHFLSLLLLTPFRSWSLESPFLFLLLLEYLLSFNLNSSDQICLFYSLHMFLHLSIRPAACDQLPFLIRSRKWPGMLGIALLLLVFTLEWSGSCRERPLWCLYWSKSSCRVVFNSLSTVFL